MNSLKHTFGMTELPRRVESYSLFGMMAEVHEKERQLQEEIERVSGENQQSRYPERTAWGHSWNTGYDA